MTLYVSVNYGYISMDVNKTKFERNSSLDYYHMTYIGKTKLETTILKANKTVSGPSNHRNQNKPVAVLVNRNAVFTRS